MANVGLPRLAGLLAATAEPEPPRTVEPGGAGSWERFWYGGPAGGRAYALYLPRRLPRGGTVPLVVALHGCGQSPEDAAAGTRLNELADREGFAVVYPEQDTHHNRRRCWNWFRPQHQGRDTGEPAAIAGIVTAVLREERRVDLDRTRVYVLGLSAGGAMASILAATYPDLFAAVGIHSGLQYAAAHSAPSAVVAMRRGGPDPERQGLLAHAAMGRRARAVPVVVVHGEADAAVSVANGELAVRQWLATARAASAAALGSDFQRPDHEHERVSPGGLRYSVRRWDVAGRPLAEYWLISGLGHAWSGGAAAGTYTDPRGPDAAAAMYRFLRGHSLEAEPTPRRRAWARLRRLLGAA